MFGMTQKQQISAHKFLNELNPQTPFTLPNHVRGDIRRQVDQGYFELLDRTRPTLSMHDEIKRSRRSKLFEYVNAMFGRTIYSENSIAGEELSGKLNRFPKQYILDGSENYTIENSDETIRFFTKTTYGGSLMVREMPVDDQHMLFPNITVAGRDAIVRPIPIPRWEMEHKPLRVRRQDFYQFLHRREVRRSASSRLH